MILENKRVRFDYDIIEKYDAGIVLHGWEVKSIRAKNANLKAAWIRVFGGEVYIEDFSVSPWKFSVEEQKKDRTKKLLLQKREILRLERYLNEKGYTIVPVSIFQKNGCLKCSIAVVKGRKKHEKRQVLKERSVEREIRNKFAS